MAQSTLELRFLGQFDIRLGEVSINIPSRPAQSLLAYLALMAGTAHRRERLAGMLWPDVEDDSARAGLRQGLWRIRKALEARLPSGVQYLLADDLTVAFNTKSAYWLDPAALDTPDDDAANVESLQHALVAYRGDLLPGFYDEWVLRERERLEGVFERKIGRLLDCLVEMRRWPEVLEWAERWIAVGHVPEPAYRALMLAHSERGDRARVATVYQRCRELLFEELGAQPSAQTRELFERLSRAEDGLAVTGTDFPRASMAAASDAQAPAPGEPPFQGLQLFDESDAERFFGREVLTARLVERLQRVPFLAVIGASGSGKSSVVRAGVVPVLRGTREWVIRVLTPGIHPLEALAFALTREDHSTGATRLALDQLTADPRGLRFWLDRNLAADRRALLLVDQFEELFTLCRDPFEREAFVDNLLEARQVGGTATVLIALRADFYPHCAQYSDLRQAVAEHQEYVGPMRTGANSPQPAATGPRACGTPPAAKTNWRSAVRSPAQAWADWPGAKTAASWRHQPATAPLVSGTPARVRRRCASSTHRSSNVLRSVPTAHNWPPLRRPDGHWCGIP
jgi:DNA-binding SARP family transcriptional activator